MSTPNAEPKKETKEGGGKKGPVGLILGIVLPALLAAGAAFGGVKFANKGAHAAPAEAAPAPHRELKPPGPTMALDPFLVSMVDANKKAHPVKLTLAIEFESTAKEDQTKTFQPRIRDAVLTHVRKLAYEDVIDSQNNEKFRNDLIERIQKSGAYNAERVLVTDLVSQ